MQLSVFLLVFSCFWRFSSTLHCYTCKANRDDNYQKHRPLCEQFDSGSQFLTDCRSSTMCFKKVTTMDLGNGLRSESTERGCALQLMSGNQKKMANGTWYYVNEIFEVYKEGCQPDPSNVHRVVKTLHCYCRGNYCNVGERTSSYALLVLSGLGLLWLRVKYNSQQIS